MNNVQNEDLEYKIVAVARRLFLERGFQNTSMSDIAATAGISRPTLHYYFRTKERMFQAVFGQLIEVFLPRLQSIVDKDSSFLQNLDEILDEYITVLSENPDLPTFIISEIHRDTDHLLQTIQQMGYQKFIERIKKQLEQEIERKELNPVPFVNVFATFYSLLMMPFVGRKLLEKFFYHEDESSFNAFIQNWKGHFMGHLNSLLTP